MNPIGFVLPAATIGLGSLLIRPQRGFLPSGAPPIVAQATIEEVHHDELTITEHPIEQGAAVADHSYKRPAEVIIRCAWSNSPSGPSSLLGAAVGVAGTLSGPLGSIARIGAAALPTLNAAQSLLSGNSPSQTISIYQKLLALQVSRVPFTILTGKRKYTDMLIQSLSVSTDKNSDNALFVTAHCKQVLIVTTQVVSVVAAAPNLANPAKNASVINNGIKQLIAAGTASLPSFLQ